MKTTTCALAAAGALALLSAAEAQAAPPWASFCTSYSERVSTAQVNAYRPMMASREHREWHYLWHAMRGSWHAFTPDLQSMLSEADPRLRPTALMAAPADAAPDDPQYDPYRNGAGETFLYMHRYMINHVQRALVDAGQPCIGPWGSVPSNPADPNWPIASPLEGVRSSETMAIMQLWETAFRDPAYLRSHSLSHVGALIELTMHNNMHMRWAALTPPAGAFPENGFGIVLNAHINGAYPPGWTLNEPANNDLTEPYSSHVNPVFWKLHGWIDATIDAWLAANGYTEIAVDCGSPARGGCYQWRDTWLGPAPGPSSPAALLAQAVARNQQRFEALSDTSRNALLSVRQAEAFAQDLRQSSLATRGWDRRAESLASQAESFSRDLERTLPADARGIVPPDDVARTLAQAGANARMDRGALTEEVLAEMREGGAFTPDEFVRRFGDRRPTQ